MFSEVNSVLENHLTCGIMSDSTMDGWCQDGSPCPCGPCAEMRLLWIEKMIPILREDHPLFARRVAELAHTHRNVRNALLAVRRQVEEIEREKETMAASVDLANGSKLGLSPEEMRAKLDRRTNLLDQAKELMTEVSDLLESIDEELGESL